MEAKQVHDDPSTRGTRQWRWLVILAVVAAAAAFLICPLAMLLLGVGLLGGGLWSRHESRNPRDRAIAGGLAAAGAAIIVTTGLLLAFLMPTSVTIDEAPVIDEVEE
jgi:ABC-type Fe3+ transport system permease subunit